MELMFEEREFTNNKGEVVKYFAYYVIIYGVKVWIKPVDKTGAELLKAVFTDA